jgi:hypothetical protein
MQHSECNLWSDARCNAANFYGVNLSVSPFSVGLGTIRLVPLSSLCGDLTALYYYNLSGDNLWHKVYGEILEKQ